MTQFVELWGSGNSATFHIDCWNGDARFYFSALLGRPEDVKKPESGNKSEDTEESPGLAATPALTARAVTKMILD